MTKKISIQGHCAFEMKKPKVPLLASSLFF